MSSGGHDRETLHSPRFVFWVTERERLHGHTHAVRVQFTGPVASDGVLLSLRAPTTSLRVTVNVPEIRTDVLACAVCSHL